MASARSEKRTKAIALAHKLVVVDGLSRGEAARALFTAGLYEGARAYPSSGWITALLRSYWARRESQTREMPEAKATIPAAHLLDTPPVAGERIADTFGVREYTFGMLTDEPGPDVRLPVFDGEPRLTGDWVICGDVHLPTTDFALAERMLETARELDMRRLLIVGDLCNFEAFSKYEHLVPPPAFETEIRVAVRLMARLAQHFEEILLVLGNHEHRLLRRSNGNINATMLGHILNAAGGKLRVSPYSHAVIESGGQKWRATHQRNYSRVKGRLADQLAQKYQANILSFHQHHVSVQRDTWNRYTVIDAGGLYDDSKMGYVKLVDSNMPVMARGFVLLVGGVGHLFTPYMSMTAWPVLVAGLRAQRMGSV